MPFTSLLGQFKGAVRTPRYAKAGLLPGRYTSTYTIQVTCQQPRLSEWTKLWRPPPIKYSPPGPVIRELRATTNFTKPDLYDLPNVYYSPLWRHLITKKEHNNRPTAGSFWSLPKVDFYSTMRQYLGIGSENSNLRVSSADYSTGAEGSRSPLPALPQSTLSAVEGHPALSKASTPLIDVRSPSGDNIGVNVDNSALEASHPVPLPPPQSQAPSASSPASDESVSSLVVPEEWKLKTTLRLDSVSPKMLLSILKECKLLQSLTADLQASDEELPRVPIIQADNLETLSIKTSAEPYPIFMALCLPKLLRLSVEWDRSKGQDRPLSHPAFGLVQLLETSSSLDFLSLSDIFPPEDDLLVVLKKQGMLCKELAIDSSHRLQPKKSQLRRLTAERRLSTLPLKGSVHPVSSTRTLNITYISADKVQPWEMTLTLHNNFSSSQVL